MIVTLVIQKSYKMEDEMISGIGRALRHSANDLRDFGLSLSEKWLREQLIGLRTCNVVSDKSTTNNLNNSEIESDITYLAQSLLGQGEYLRCTHLLRKIHPSNATPLSRFLYCYSCYMAGEKIKTQKKIENVSSRNSSDGATLPDKKESLLNGKNQIAKNPNLRDLFDEMYPVFREFQDQISSGEYSKLYSQQQSSVATSSIKMNGLQMYLFAIVVRDLIRQGGGPIFLIESSNPLPYPAGINDSYDDDFLRNIPREDVYADKMGGLSSAPFPSVYTLFSYAAHLFPCNWSCWLELSAQCIADQRAPPEWDDLCTVLPDCVPTQAPDRCTGAGSIQFNSVIGKVMYQSFLAHHFVETQQAVLAMEILTDLVYLFPDSQIVAAQVALAHFSVRSYDESEAVFLGIREADPYRLDHLNVFSNILFVKDSKNQLSDLAHRVVKINKYAPETCVVVGNYYAIKGNHERAILYFQRALRLNDRFLEAWTLMGHEYLELMNASAAIEAYRGASDRSPTEYRAWYGLGQAYEMLHLFQYSLYYHKKAAALCPSDARTWCAVGICYSKLGMKTDAILALDRAVQCGDNEGVATRELARLYR